MFDTCHPICVVKCWLNLRLELEYLVLQKNASSGPNGRSLPAPLVPSQERIMEEQVFGLQIAMDPSSLVHLFQIGLGIWSPVGIGRGTISNKQIFRILGFP